MKLRNLNKQKNIETISHHNVNGTDNIIIISLYYNSISLTNIKKFKNTNYYLLENIIAAGQWSEMT